MWPTLNPHLFLYAWSVKYDSEDLGLTAVQTQGLGLCGVLEFWVSPAPSMKDTSVSVHLAIWVYVQRGGIVFFLSPAETHINQRSTLAVKALLCDSQFPFLNYVDSWFGLSVHFSGPVFLPLFRTGQRMISEHPPFCLEWVSLLSI